MPEACSVCHPLADSYDSDEYGNTGSSQSGGAYDIYGHLLLALYESGIERECDHSQHPKIVYFMISGF